MIVASKLDKVYNEYFEQFKSLIDSDEFYNYIVENIGAGTNKFSFYQKKKDKKIDVRWIEQIENCIVELDTIIRNPRRFIVQEEEIVPIEKARRITNESVRHLAQHTNLIARVDGDRVTPNEILNVYREESFDIYENRFIYTLLGKVEEFVESRRQVLLNITDDEEIAELAMEGVFNNGEEDVNYKFEISSTTKNALLNADTTRMGVFARIERLSRIIREFRGSAFAKSMRGSAPVRPPIMRTNVILKDPNFKKCLVLWQFIETYHEVGYTIDIINEYRELTQEAVFTFYNTLALNYIFLKKSADSTDDVDLEHKKKRRQIKPKFVKNIVEEIVDDYDIYNTEVRRVFLDEITKAAKKREKQDAQIAEAINNALKAERDAKLEAARLEKERIAREKAEEKARIAKQKAREEAARKREEERIAKEKKREADRIAREKAKAEKEAALEKERIAKQKAKEKAAKEKAIALEKEKKAKEKAKEREKAQKLKLAAIEKEKAEKQKAKDKERAEKEKALALEKEKLAKQKAKDKEKAAREKALAEEKEKAAKAKAKEREKAAKQKAAALEKEKLAKQKAREKEKAAKEKALALEKEKLAKQKAKEKEKAAKEKAAALEKEKLAKQKAKEKEKAAKEKAAALEKEKLAKQKAKEKEKAAKEKAAALEKEKLAKQKAKEKEKATKAKASVKKTPAPKTPDKLDDDVFDISDAIGIFKLDE
ncbi:MAG: DUF2357 domain-containing protein [Ruminococcaceae bacterium]|nr:DUF2357 domain-containing protein [Oscillospiraceae bacterium]